VNPFIDMVRSPAAKLELAVQLRRQKMIGRYQFRKLAEGPMPFKLAMKLITQDFKEAFRSTVRRHTRGHL
jgi:hypothetical protein